MKIHSPDGSLRSSLTSLLSNPSAILGPLGYVFAIALAIMVTPALAFGPKAYIGNYKDNSVSVIDTATNRVVATVAVVAGPHGMGITPDGRRVFVSGDNASGVSVIDTASDQVIQVIEVGKAPHGMALTPDGNLLLVGVYGEGKVAFVDVASNAVVATVPVANPHTIAIRPDGKMAYVASQEPGKFALVVVDLVSRTVTKSLPLEKAPRDPEFGYDGKALYFTEAGVNAIEVLDPRTDKIVAEVPTGVSPHIAKLYRGARIGTAVVQGP